MSGFWDIDRNVDLRSLAFRLEVEQVFGPIDFLQYSCPPLLGSYVLKGVFNRQLGRVAKWQALVTIGRLGKALVDPLLIPESDAGKIVRTFFKSLAYRAIGIGGPS